MGGGSKAEVSPRIVVLGGGTGLSVMLRGLKHKPLHITAIVTLGDDGGSSGILRTEMDMPPPGDIRNVLIALADVEPMLSKMLQFRFQSGSGLAGHSLGNLIIAAMKEISGDFVTAIKALSKVLAVRGQVLPATADAIVLKAELEDGRVITGESNIPRARGRIRRMMIEPPDAKPLEEALEAIREADAILVGPGSLYTSIIPNLLVPEIARAIRESGAVKLYVCNIMTQPGETDGYTVSDHLNAIFRHVGHHLFDYVIVNNGDIPRHVMDRYAQEGAVPVRIDEDEIRRIGCAIIADRLFEYRQYLRHDAALLSDHIYRLVLKGMRK